MKVGPTLKGSAESRVVEFQKSNLDATITGEGNDDKEDSPRLPDDFVCTLAMAYCPPSNNDTNKQVNTFRELHLKTLAVKGAVENLKAVESDGNDFPAQRKCSDTADNIISDTEV